MFNDLKFEESFLKITSYVKSLHVRFNFASAETKTVIFSIEISKYTSGLMKDGKML